MIATNNYYIYTEYIQFIPDTLISSAENIKQARITLLTKEYRLYGLISGIHPPISRFLANINTEDPLFNLIYMIEPENQTDAYRKDAIIYSQSTNGMYWWDDGDDDDEDEEEDDDDDDDDWSYYLNFNVTNNTTNTEIYGAHPPIFQFSTQYHMTSLVFNLTYMNDRWYE